MTTQNDLLVKRRDFLKVSGAAASMALLNTKVFANLTKNGLEDHRVNPKPSNNQGEWKSSYCTGCHQPTCAIKVKVVNGVATEVIGDPISITNKGQLCPRGAAILFNLYNPYRVKAPLKRTNPKRELGEDPGWVEISWDEALDIVSNKVIAARKENPGSFVYLFGFGDEENRKALPFRKAGKTNSVGTAGNLCPVHFGPLSLSGTTMDRLDIERCNYVVVIGGNLGGNVAVSSGSTFHLTKAMERGMRVVSVDPRSTWEGQRGQWVPIRPGTETALGLGLVNCIIHEIGKFDEHWLRVRSNAPYLIKETYKTIKGTKVIMEDYYRDPESGKPLVWDTVNDKAVPFDHSKGETYALTGSYSVNDENVKPIFQVLSDYVKEYTPDWAEGVTTIPASTIRDIANNLVREAKIGATINIEGFEFPYSPACVYIRRGAVAHKLGNQAYKSLELVNMLLGNIDVPGGILANAVSSFTTLLATDEDGVGIPTFEMVEQILGREFQFPPKSIDMSNYYPEQHTLTHMVWKAINDPKKYHLEFPINVLLIMGGNPITSNANANEAIEAFQKIPFITSIAYHVDEPTQLADVVLPEDSPLESTNFFRLFRVQIEATDENRGLYGTFVKRGVVERLYDTRNANDILMQVAHNAGFLSDLNQLINKGLVRGDKPTLAPEFEIDPEKLYTYDEIVERKIRSDFGADKSYQDFDVCAFMPDPLPTIRETYNYYYAPENAVRLPIYWGRMPKIVTSLLDGLHQVGVSVPNQDEEDFIRHYSAFPIWYEAPTYGTNPEYPYYVVNWKTHFINQNTHDRVENPWLQEILDKFVIDMKVILVPKTIAASAGVVDGDMVWIESSWGGKTQGKVKVTGCMHPECLGIGGNFGRKGLHMNPIAKEGPQYNQLLASHEGTFDPVSGALENAPRVKLYKA